MGDDDVEMCNPPRRVARTPRNRYSPSTKEYQEALSGLLSKIESSYMEAQIRLALRGRPVTLSRLLEAGVCIGLLDPVSSIMVNTICTSERVPDLRAKALAVSVVDEMLAEMARLSMRGLIAFLVYFFPYLAEWEAVRYLFLADADLLCAARTIVADRGMLQRFSLDSPVSAPAVEKALALAAQVAKHPQPSHVARVWMMLSPRLHQALSLLSEVDSGSSLWQVEQLLKTMLDDPVAPELATAWDFAALRPTYGMAIASIPYQHTRSLRMVLLDTIHGFYLQALARLPSGELRSHLHRSLLRAGYCYGPMDPVSNIIYNTIWYHANFPAAVTPVLDVIGPDSLTRLESRSFYGLVSFILTRYHHLSMHQAVQCLIAAGGQLSIADPNFLPAAVRAAKGSDSHHLHHCMNNHCNEVIRNVEQQSPCASIQEAYMAAAIAAWHPNPDEQAAFLASWKEADYPVMSQLLTSEDVHRWTQFMSPEQPPTPERVCKSGYSALAGKMRSEAQQRRVFRKVKAALRKYLVQDGEPAYDLHIISCVNEKVGGTVFCEEAANDWLSFAPCRHLYTHVNFFATRKDSLSSTSYPTLFFAEFDNEKKDGAPLVCCPVQEPIAFAAEHVRCLYCEAEGAKVVHPTSLEFHGGGDEFEKVIRKEHSMSNGWLICKNDFAVNRMYAVEEDLMYVDVNESH